ncbi:MAG TPA: hypothetical protein VGS62_06330 [Streptosporangiaceae bacterium]|nr:hypothetical protein [Streptosporangiaceae bacterium]
MTASTAAGGRRLALTTGLIILGIVFAVVGVIYEVRTAGRLPSFFPGHQVGSATHHIKHGLAAFALALIAWIGAWFSTGRRQSTRSHPDDAL